MDKRLNDYLEKIDKYLKPMPVADRVDIVKEIKSNIIDLQTQEGMLPEQIIERLGDPKKLAKAYLSEAITETHGMSWKKFGAMFAFYSLTGLSGMIVLPTTGITAVALMLSGALAPVCGLIKFLVSLIGIDIPLIAFQIGNFVASPSQSLFLSIIAGVVLYGIGWGLWKVTIAYIRAVSAQAEKINSRM